MLSLYVHICFEVRTHASEGELFGKSRQSELENKVFRLLFKESKQEAAMTTRPDQSIFVTLNILQCYTHTITDGTLA